MAVYLLCWAPAYLGSARPHGSASHYLGWAPDEGLDARLAEHAAGRGAKITAAAVARGFALTVARTWPGDRTDERRLKRRKEAPRLCPLCRARQQPANRRREVMAQR